MREQPNFVVCICDQLQTWATGCYGNDFVRTPAIDRLAAEGTRFEYGVTPYPVCMPARSALISGRYNRSCTGGVSNVAYPTRPGDFAMPEYPERGRPHVSAPTVAELLRDAGYDTGVIGKWHIHSRPHDVGFDYSLIPRVHHAHTAQLFSENGGPEFVAPGYSLDFEVDQVDRYLSQHAGDSHPFFLYYSISPPHCPVADIPEEYRTMYAPADVPLRANVPEDLAIPDPDHWYRVYRWDYRYYSLELPYTDTLPTPYGLRELSAEYYGAVSWTDSAVGRMLESLDRNGLADDTIVLFVADHGDNLGSHGLIQKGTPNTESVRIPFIVRDARNVRDPRDAGDVRRSTAPRHITDVSAGLVDIAPTLLSLTGLEIPDHFQGKSLSPWIRPTAGTADTPDAKPPAETATYFETGRGVGVYDRNLVYYADRDPQTGALADRPAWAVDVVTDPYERTAREGATLSEADARRLRAMIEDWNERTPFGV